MSNEIESPKTSGVAGAAPILPPKGTHGFYKARHAVTVDEAEDGIVTMEILFPMDGQDKQTAGLVKDFQWVPVPLALEPESAVVNAVVTPGIAVEPAAEPAHETSPIVGEKVALAPDVDTIRRALRRRYKPGQIIELRVPGVTKGSKKVVLGGVYDDQGKLTSDIAQIVSTTNAPAIYTGLQEIKNDAAHRAVVTNDFAAGRDGAGAGDIEQYRWLLIDVDAVRARGFEKSSSTDAEKAAAGEVLNAILEYFIDLDITGDVIDSGNSYHFIPSIDLPASPENEDLLKKVLEKLAARFDTPYAHVDTGVYDRPRICKLPGTLSRKGISTADRPHRVSTIINEASDPAPIPLKVLLDIAELIEPPKPVVQVAAATEEIRERMNYVLAFAEWAGFTYGNEKPHSDGGLFVVMKSFCPFDDHGTEHHEGECHIGVNAEGKHCFSCKHHTCKGKRGWKEFRAEVERQRGEAFQPKSGLIINGVSLEESAKRVRETKAAKKADAPESLSQARTLNFVRGDARKPVRVEWLWRNRIVFGNLNAFSGEPDVGKGMTIVDIAARITTHRDFPDAKNELGGPKDVLFLSSEDDMDNTLIPRLIVAGAEMSRIHFAEISENISGKLEEGIVCLDRDLPMLEAKIKENPDIVLIVPDPIISFLGDADPNKDKEVRPIYSRMKAFAKRLSVSWLFVNHWNKNQSATSINRTSGAKTMVSAPRATWMFMVSPEDTSRYLMMRGKGNLSKKSGTGAVKTLAYRIVSAPLDFHDGRPADPDGVPKLVWDGETEHTCDDLLQEANDPNKRSNKAEELLKQLLASGAKLATDIYRAGESANLSPEKMKRARYALSYPAEKIGERWYWAKSAEDVTALKIQFYRPGDGVTINGENAGSGKEITAKRWLKCFLATKAVPTDTIRAAAEDEGFNWESVRKNRHLWGVESHDKDGSNYWRNEQ